MALGEFEQLLLFALARLGDEAHGSTIRRELERRAGRVVSPGAVYTALDRLESRGLVVSWLGGGTPERGGRRRRFYRLEPEGARELHSAYASLQRMAEGIAERLPSLRDGPSGAPAGPAARRRSG